MVRCIWSVCTHRIHCFRVRKRSTLIYPLWNAISGNVTHRRTTILTKRIVDKNFLCDPNCVSAVEEFSLDFSKRARCRRMKTNEDNNSTKKGTHKCQPNTRAQLFTMICIARNPHNSQTQKINKRSRNAREREKRKKKLQIENKTKKNNRRKEKKSNAQVPDAAANITEYVTRQCTQWSCTRFECNQMKRAKPWSH